MRVAAVDRTRSPPPPAPHPPPPPPPTTPPPRPRYRCAATGHAIIGRQLAAAGGDGPVEGLGSGTALARLPPAAGINAVGAALVRLVTAGDPAARAVWNEAIFAAALGVVNLAHIVAPTVVVVGGGMGRNRELVLAPIRAALARFGPAGPPVTVITAALDDDSGLRGAARRGAA